MYVCVCSVLVIMRQALAQVVEVLHYKTEVTGSIPCGVLPAALWHRSRLNLRNEYQGYLLGGKDCRSVGLTTLTPPCAVKLFTDPCVRWGDR